MLYVSVNLLAEVWLTFCATPLSSYVFTSNTAGHDNHEKIKLVAFQYGYGPPLYSRLRLLQ